jgi:DNA (cytosine-5)-methyltransferase 1
VTYKVLSLFAGIGGFDLGLERTGGFKTVAFCEIDKKAQAVLRKHWTEVTIYDDVTSLTAEQLAADGIAVDVICGGFPCQDISTAGLGAGIAEGTRSGLWFHYARLIRELRPRLVIVENVSALLGRGLDAVLGDLAAIGYDAWWDCIPAFAVGAPHRRDRIWIVGYPRRAAGERDSGALSGAEARERGAREQHGDQSVGPKHAGSGCGARLVAHSEGIRRVEVNENPRGRAKGIGSGKEHGPWA